MFNGVLQFTEELLGVVQTDVVENAEVRDHLRCHRSMPDGADQRTRNFLLVRWLRGRCDIGHVVPFNLYFRFVTHDRAII